VDELSKERVLREIRRDVADRGRSTRYSEAVNRYLGALAYTGPGPAPAPVPRTAPPPAAGTVVAAVDDSPTSFIAADHAAIEAELHGWKLRIVHVRQTAAQHSEPGPDTALLEELTARVHARSRSVPVRSSLVIGEPVTTLLAEGKHADLVVVGSRHGTTDAMLGRTVGAPVAAHHTGPRHGRTGAGMAARTRVPPAADRRPGRRITGRGAGDRIRPGRGARPRM
jgi:nucleotide-binding universal stress UspA family protein